MDNTIAYKQDSTTARGFVVQSDDAPGFWQLGNLWRVMATGVQPGDSFCLLDQLVMADGGCPCTHAHAQDEGLYVVSGHCTFHAWGLTIAAGPGEFVACGRGDRGGALLVALITLAGRPRSESMATGTAARFTEPDLPDAPWTAAYGSSIGSDAARLGARRVGLPDLQNAGTLQ